MTQYAASITYKIYTTDQKTFLWSSLTENATTVLSEMVSLNHIGFCHK